MYILELVHLCEVFSRSTYLIISINIKNMITTIFKAIHYDMEWTNLLLFIPRIAHYKNSVCPNPAITCHPLRQTSIEDHARENPQLVSARTYFPACSAADPEAGAEVFGSSEPHGRSRGKACWRLHSPQRGANRSVSEYVWAEARTSRAGCTVGNSSRVSGLRTSRCA